MRTTIIPAQITTVEDKITGALSLTQILILMVPIFLTAIIYTLFFPIMELAPYKLTLILISSSICLTLALRIKNKIIASWLIILFKYQSRPKFYLFNKNDLNTRKVYLPKQIQKTSKHKKVKKIKLKTKEIKLAEIIRMENLINSGKVALHYQFDNKRS